MILKNKIKTAFWIASHCPTEIKREAYVKALQQFVDVDIYGECGNLTCPNGGIDKLASNYYFYLSFENSICPDYITEKYWRNFNHPVVPVVMGGGNYSESSGFHSFIDVNDYETVQDLANYLKYLINNRTEYLQYFKWKNDVVMYQKDEWCRLCEKLHDPSEPEQVYHNMTQWFYYDSKGDYQCSYGRERKYYNSIKHFIF